MRTCRICNKQYSDNWSNWYGKFCCKECYKKADSIFYINDEIYTYADKKITRSGYSTAYLTKGIIVNIYKLCKPTPNGIYQYAIKLEDGHVKYRFFKDIYTNKEECIKAIDVINKRREIMRQANNLLKEV